jgi:excisionase family DNA binding protein
VTIYRLITDDHLPALRVGRSYRIPTTAVTNHLATQTTEQG